METHYRTPSFEVCFAEKKEPAKKIQLFRVGSFYHPQHGKFEITAQTLSQMKENFDKKVRRIDLAVDFSHKNTEEAAAWIKSLEIEGEGLFAEVEWTPSGLKSVSGKEFRYISPEFTFEYQDNESLQEHGAVLLGAALTNRPVIKEMEPVIELHEEIKPIKKETEMSDKVIKASDHEAVVEELDLKKAELKDVTSKLESVENELAELKKKMELSEKEASFSKLLSEGKVCPAQKEAYLKDDMGEFIKLAEPMKLKAEGSAHAPKEESESKPVDDRIHELAEQYVSEKKAKSIVEAYSLVLADNPKLVQEKYK